MSRVGLKPITVNGFKFEVTKSVASLITDLLKPYTGIQVEFEKKPATLSSEQLFKMGKARKVEEKAEAKAKKEAKNNS